MKKIIASLLAVILSFSVLTAFAVESDELATDGWTFDASSVNANGGVPCELAEYVADGNTKSHWHSMINPKAELPQSFTVILPEQQLVSGYRYYPRADGGAGICSRYELYVSGDGKDFTMVASGNWATDTKPKTIIFGANLKVKAVKLVILEALFGYASAGEIRLLSPKSNYKTVNYNVLKNDFDNVFYKPVTFEGIKVKCSAKAAGSAQEITSLADGKWETFWHSRITPKEALPMEIDYDFNSKCTIQGLRYVPRQDGNLTGHFQKFSVYSSDDGTDYTFLKEFTCSEISITAKDFFLDEPVRTRYFKIILTEGLSGYGTGAELSFLQTENQYKRDYKGGEITYTLNIGSNEVKVLKEEKTTTLTLDVAPFISAGSTMVPLRGLMEEMGMTVDWTAANQEIWIFDPHTDIIMRVEDDRVYINDVRYNASAPPTIRNSRTYIPLRFMSEHLGYNVYWDGDKQEIKISNR